MPKNLIHNNFSGKGIKGTIIHSLNFSVNSYIAIFFEPISIGNIPGFENQYLEVTGWIEVLHKNADSAFCVRKLSNSKYCLTNALPSLAFALKRLAQKEASSGVKPANKTNPYITFWASVFANENKPFQS